MRHSRIGYRLRADLPHPILGPQSELLMPYVGLPALQNRNPKAASNFLPACLDSASSNHYAPGRPGALHF